MWICFVCIALLVCLLYAAVSHWCEMLQFDGDPTKFEAASADVVQRYEEFGRRLLTDETDLYRKRLFLAVCLIVTCADMCIFFSSSVMKHSCKLFRYLVFYAVTFVCLNLDFL